MKGGYCLIFLLAMSAGCAQTVPTAEQPTESPHRLGPNGLEGWTLNYTIADRPGEQYPEVLVLARRGRIIRRIQGSPFVWNWMFRARGRLKHWSDKAIALPGNGFDIERLVGRVAQGLAEFHDRSIQAVIEIDEGVGRPEMLAQLLARDHLPSVFKQQEQNARRLFAQLDEGAIAPQFSTRGVQ